MTKSRAMISSSDTVNAALESWCQKFSLPGEENFSISK